MLLSKIRLCPMKGSGRKDRGDGTWAGKGLLATLCFFSENCSSHAEGVMHTCARAAALASLGGWRSWSYDNAMSLAGMCMYTRLTCKMHSALV
eukprot:1160540-Pelagomonas_calceolata.AAC.5